MDHPACVLGHTSLFHRFTNRAPGIRGVANHTGSMHTLPIFSRSKIHARIAALILLSVISLTASASAADALTNAAVKTVGKGVLGSLFKKRSRVVDSTEVTRVSAMDRVNRSILGLPLGILRAVGKGVTRAASKTVTDHITHN